MNAYVPSSSSNPDSDHSTGSTIMPITDCSRLPFDVTILDESVFKFVSIQSAATNTAGRSDNTNNNNACAVVVLDSLRPGRTSIKLSYSPPGDISSSLVSNDMQIGSYSKLKSHKTQITLAKDSSLVINLYDGPLFSSMSVSSSSPSSSNEGLLSSVSGIGYQSDVAVSADRDSLEIVSLENGEQPNRYSYRVKCRKIDDSGELSVKFSLSHKKTVFNKCPLVFDYKLKVRCTEPTSLELGQLFVNNDENTGNVLSGMKWKCPIKLSANYATAHTDRPLYVQLTARDSLGNVFDNFTSLKTEWQISDRGLLERSRSGGGGGGHADIESMEVVALDDATLILLDRHEDLPNSNRLFYQRFETRNKLGDTKVSVKMFIEGKFVNLNGNGKEVFYH